MSNASIPISIRVKKSKSKMFKEFLKSLDYVEFEDDDYRGFSPERFVPATKVQGESLKSFAGSWKDNPIDANKLREEAWQRGKRK